MSAGRLSLRLQTLPNGSWRSGLGFCWEMGETACNSPLVPFPVTFRDMNMVEVAAIQYHLPALFPEPSNGRSLISLDVEVSRRTRGMFGPLATPRDPCVLAICADNRHATEMALDVIQLSLY